MLPVVMRSGTRSKTCSRKYTCNCGAAATVQTRWQKAGNPLDASTIGRLVASAEQRDRELHQSVRRRDLIETTVALLIAPFFAFFTWITLGKSLWLAAAASALLSAWSLFVPWRLRQVRKLQPDPTSSTDMLTYLRAEKEATQAQYKLMHGILRWYLGPAGIGVILLFFGIRGWSAASFYYSLAVLALYLIIYLGNRRAASRNIAPKIEQIKCQINEISRGDEP